MPGLREWLAGGLPEMEKQRDEAFANYNQVIGAMRAIEATLRWLDQNAGVEASPPPRDEEGEGIPQ